MRLEAASDETPREVVSRAVVHLLDEGWTLRSLSESHLHLVGKRVRSPRGLIALLLAVFAGFAALLDVAVFFPEVRFGRFSGPEALGLYSAIAWPGAFVAIVVHLLRTRGEAGLVLAALPLPGGGAHVIGQAYGSARAHEQLEAFLERVRRPGDGAESLRVADHPVRR